MSSRTSWARSSVREDVIGAFADGHQRRVSIEPFDLVLGRIAIAAVDGGIASSDALMQTSDA